jgi:mRNA interferase RelE/StbE
MWDFKYKKRFLKELSKLPSDIQDKIEKRVFDELPGKNPFAVGYIEKMQGYSDKYKIRIGDYRIGLTIEKSYKLVIFQRIAHRRDIYNIFP